MSKTTAKTTEKKELQKVFTLWKKTSKDGKKTFFSGQTEDKSMYLTAFYNTNKKNLKEPDLRVYPQDNLKEEYCSLWAKATKDGKKKYLSGKLRDKWIVGFINEKATGKQPYISVYFSDEEKKEEAKEEPTLEPIGADEDLPF